MGKRKVNDAVFSKLFEEEDTIAEELENILMIYKQTKDEIEKTLENKCRQTMRKMGFDDTTEINKKLFDQLFLFLSLRVGRR